MLCGVARVHLSLMLSLALGLALVSPLAYLRALTRPVVQLILRLEEENTVVGEDRRTGESITLSDFNYFIFGGPEELQWSPAIYAKLAYEGFFTITTGGTLVWTALKAEILLSFLSLLPPSLFFPFSHRSIFYYIFKLQLYLIPRTMSRPVLARATLCMRISTGC